MVAVSPARVDDPDALQLLSEYRAFRIAGFPGTYVAASPDPSAFTPPRGVFLVARDDGGAIGCGGVRRIAPGPDGERWEIKHLFVRQSGRGTGTGAALLDALERTARAHGAAEIVLDTHDSLTAAGRLYARHGFTAIDAYNDNPNANVWLRKPLD